MSETIKQQPEQQAEQAQPTAPEVDYENMARSDYLQLPKEEQDRLCTLRQQRVREAPTLYEWDIRVASLYGMYGLGWLIMLSPCIIMAIIDGIMTYEEGSVSWGGIVMAVLLGLYIRYLWLADKLYHYRLTTEGLVTTYHDAIPDVAYTIMRGLAWFGVVVCIAAVAVMGPAALVGAGGFAVGAFFFTGFKNEESTYESPLKNGYPHLIKVTLDRPYIACQSTHRTMGLRSNIHLHCPVDELHTVLTLLMQQLPGSEIRRFKNERLVHAGPFASPESGEPARLSDFAPRSADS